MIYPYKSERYIHSVLQNDDGKTVYSVLRFVVESEGAAPYFQTAALEGESEAELKWQKLNDNVVTVHDLQQNVPVALLIHENQLLCYPYLIQFGIGIYKAPPQTFNPLNNNWRALTGPQWKALPDNIQRLRLPSNKEESVLKYKDIDPLLLTEEQLSKFKTLETILTTVPERIQSFKEFLNAITCGNWELPRHICDVIRHLVQLDWQELHHLAEKHQLKKTEYAHIINLVHLGADVETYLAEHELLQQLEEVDRWELGNSIRALRNAFDANRLNKLTRTVCTYKVKKTNAEGKEVEEEKVASIAQLRLLVSSWLTQAIKTLDASIEVKPMQIVATDKHEVGLGNIPPDFISDTALADARRLYWTIKSGANHGLLADEFALVSSILLPSGAPSRHTEAAGILTYLEAVIKAEGRTLPAAANDATPLVTYLRSIYRKAHERVIENVDENTPKEKINAAIDELGLEKTLSITSDNKIHLVIYSSEISKKITNRFLFNSLSKLTETQVVNLFIAMGKTNYFDEFTADAFWELYDALKEAYGNVHELLLKAVIPLKPDFITNFEKYKIAYKYLSADQAAHIIRPFLTSTVINDAEKLLPIITDDSKTVPEEHFNESAVNLIESLLFSRYQEQEALRIYLEVAKKADGVSPSRGCINNLRIHLCIFKCKKLAEKWNRNTPKEEIHEAIQTYGLSTLLAHASDDKRFLIIDNLDESISKDQIKFAMDSFRFQEFLLIAPVNKLDLLLSDKEILSRLNHNHINHIVDRLPPNTELVDNRIKKLFEIMDRNGTFSTANTFWDFHRNLEVKYYGQGFTYDTPRVFLRCKFQTAFVTYMLNGNGVKVSELINLLTIDSDHSTFQFLTLMRDTIETCINATPDFPIRILHAPLLELIYTLLNYKKSHANSCTDIIENILRQLRPAIDKHNQAIFSHLKDSIERRGDLSADENTVLEMVFPYIKDEALQLHPVQPRVGKFVTDLEMRRIIERLDVVAPPSSAMSVYISSYSLNELINLGAKSTKLLHLTSQPEVINGITTSHLSTLLLYSKNAEEFQDFCDVLQPCATRFLPNMDSLLDMVSRTKENTKLIARLFLCFKDRIIGIITSLQNKNKNELPNPFYRVLREASKKNLRIIADILWDNLPTLIIDSEAFGVLYRCYADEPEKRAFLLKNIPARFHSFVPKEDTADYIIYHKLPKSQNSLFCNIDKFKQDSLKDLDKRYSKFTRPYESISDPLKRLKKQIGALMINYDKPRSGWFLSGHWNRNFNGSGANWLEFLTRVKSIDELALHVRSEHRQSPSKGGSLNRRINYAAYLVYEALEQERQRQISLASTVASQPHRPTI